MCGRGIRFFQRDPSMEIFSDDVALVDSISQYLGWGEQKTVHGKDSYRRHMWSLRFHAALLFHKSQVLFKHLASLGKVASTPQTVCWAM